MQRPRLTQAARQLVYLAYTQQLENIREAKRLQWHMTYLGVGALVALAGAYQLLRQWDPGEVRFAAQVLAVLAGTIAVATAMVIEAASDAAAGHRQTLVEIARDLEELDGLSEPYLTQRLGIPEDYGQRSRPEPRFLQLVLCIAAGVLGWLMLGSFPSGVLIAALAGALGASVMAARFWGWIWW